MNDLFHDYFKEHVELLFVFRYSELLNICETLVFCGFYLSGNMASVHYHKIGQLCKFGPFGRYFLCLLWRKKAYI